MAAQSWDIALVDEAHYARRSNSAAGLVVQPKYGDLYRAVEKTLRPRTRALWLATATPTPMQLDPIEVRLGRMINVVGDQQVSLLPVTEEDFRRLAASEVTEQGLVAEARQRINITQQRVRSAGPERL